MTTVLLAKLHANEAPGEPLINLFTIDLRTCPEWTAASGLDPIYYITTAPNITTNGINWQQVGVTSSGWSYGIGDQFPEPTLTVERAWAPIKIMIQTLDLKRAKISRIQTYPSLTRRPDFNVKDHATVDFAFINKVDDYDKMNINLKLGMGTSTGQTDSSSGRTLTTANCSRVYRYSPDGLNFVNVPVSMGGCPWGQNNERDRWGFTGDARWGQNIRVDGASGAGVSKTQDICPLTREGCRWRFNPDGVDGKPLPFLGVSGSATTKGQ